MADDAELELSIEDTIKLLGWEESAEADGVDALEGGDDPKTKIDVTDIDTKAPTVTPTAPDEPTIPVESKPAVPPTAQPDVSADIAQLREYERQIAEYQHKELLSQVETLKAKSVKWYTEKGIDDELAKQLAQKDADYALAIIEQRRLQAENEQVAKRQVAEYYAKLHNVDAERLMQYATPQEMEAAAISRKAETAELETLKTRLAALEKGKVEPQELDTGRGTKGGMTAKQRQIAYATGKLQYEDLKPGEYDSWFRE